MKKEKGKVKSEKCTAKPTITLDDVHEDVATWENQRVEKRMAKPKMTAEQKMCLAACKSLDADVERAKEITACSDHVLHELCKSCKNVKACKKLKGLPKLNCRMAAIASVAVGVLMEGGAK